MKKIALILTGLIVMVSCKKENKSALEKTHNENALPNIILLIGDDQGYSYFGFMGADYVQTPNMDALAKSGTLFTNGYVPENHCRPSLQTLMTGTLPIDYNSEVENRIDEELNKDRSIPYQDVKEWKRNYRFHAMKHFTTLPKLLKQKGYKSFQGGKWWEFNYQNGGFDEGMTKGWSKKDESKNDWFLQFMGGKGRELVRAGMQPVYEFIDKNAQQPKFIWFAPELPHYPFDAPGKYYNIYKNKDMSESAKRYYANCTWFDDGVGELVNYLKEKNEFNNTLFIYVNDNGWEQAPKQEFRHDSLRWHNGVDKGKLSMYDQSFRTPIIFSWKDKIIPNKINTSFIHSADIPATALDYVGIDIPEDYFGISYKYTIENSTSDSSTRHEIIGNINQLRSEDDMMGMAVEGYWIRSGKWFYSWNLTTKTERLFNSIEDPNCTTDLVLKHTAKAQKFKDKLTQWKTSKGR